jgi:hypothetical protein
MIIHPPIAIEEYDHSRLNELIARTRQVIAGAETDRPLRSREA